jgi:hypothetical protein
MTILKSLAASADSGVVTPPEPDIYAYASDISRTLTLDSDITLDSTTDFKFSFEVKEVVGGDPSELFTFLGSGSTAGIILRKSDGLFLFRVPGNSNLVRAEGYYTINTYSYIRYEFAYESATDTFTISANDSVIYTSVQNGVSFSLTDNRLFVHGTAKLFVKDVKLEKNGIVTNHWYNTTGTGNVLTDHVGGNHATLSLPATSATWADAPGAFLSLASNATAPLESPTYLKISNIMSQNGTDGIYDEFSIYLELDFPVQPPDTDVQFLLDSPLIKVRRFPYVGGRMWSAVLGRPGYGGLVANWYIEGGSTALPQLEGKVALKFVVKKGVSNVELDVYKGTDETNLVLIHNTISNDLLNAELSEYSSIYDRINVGIDYYGTSSDRSYYGKFTLEHLKIETPQGFLLDFDPRGFNGFEWVDTQNINTAIVVNPPLDNSHIIIGDRSYVFTMPLGVESKPIPNFLDFVDYSIREDLTHSYSVTGEDFIFESRCRVSGYDETSSRVMIISAGDAYYHYRFGFREDRFYNSDNRPSFDYIKTKYPSWDIANWHTYTVKRDNPSSGQFRQQLFIDGVFISEHITSNDYSYYLKFFLSPNVGPGEIQTQYIRIYNDSGVSPVLVFDADLVHSEQTDDVIVDTVSGNTQVLNYSPVDNSHWQLLEDN